MADPKTSESKAAADAPAAAPAAEPVETKSKADKAGLAAVAKAAGVDPKDVTAYNAETKVIVTAQGGKYQLSADSKKLRHLAGPAPRQEQEDK